MTLLQTLAQTDGVSGNESAVCDIIKRETAKYCDEVSLDAIGNVIAHKKGKGARIMYAAHMDEIGIMVTFIDEKGFLRFAPVGGLYIKDLVGRRVRFGNGISGVIWCEDEDKKPELKKLYIDVGGSTEIKVGDTAAFAGEYVSCGDTVISKALDNRAGCYAVMEAAKLLKDTDADMYYVFTAQEEVGLRGARCGAYEVEPDYAVAFDVTDTGDTPGAEKMAVKLGAGAAIKVMDRSILCDADIREAMKTAATENNIPYQLEIMTDGGTDAGAIHLTRSGVKTGGISIPARYIHSPSEMINKKDLEACIKLAAALPAKL